jgi:hypothetical protein
MRKLSRRVVVAVAVVTQSASIEEQLAERIRLQREKQQNEK